MKKRNIRWSIVGYDVLIFFAVNFILYFLYINNGNLTTSAILTQIAVSFLCIFFARFAGGIYQQIWRYGGIQCYIRMILFDSIAFLLTLVVEAALSLFLEFERIALAHLIAIACMDLMGTLSIRMVYRYAYKCSNDQTDRSKFLKWLLRVFAGVTSNADSDGLAHKIKIAIIGAGKVGVSLAEDLLANKSAPYVPRCFIDTNESKVGREIHGIPVLSEDEATLDELQDREIQEIVFAIPTLKEDVKKKLYHYYAQAGYKVKTYDFPTVYSTNGKRRLRSFEIEDLLFRKPIVISNPKLKVYYRDKIILVTGGGGSIGSELCRQLAKNEPKQIIILDICENGAYDVQQELKMQYGNALDLQIEICSITDRKALDRVFKKYNPDIVINAAAHKHVPLMERNCIEAVQNNVFGTKNLVDMCEHYGTKRFMMVSTDKAVNPTNVMGATKRMCEMIVQSASANSKVTYSATRFGNVLGSAGSVIPLFKRQIARGGPITLTDKRIIRYFMTIPEASQLVLESGTMAQNGELFVLDMGQPIKILDLAESMLRLSGVSGIEIVETGLRPGEKLYEELLVKTEKLDKSENELIFIEKDMPLDKEDIDARLRKLHEACETGDDEAVRQALREVVPTYKTPEEVNSNAEDSEEMKAQKVIDAASV